ncbi:MAG: 16S rRNA (cytidine(1402)-2'-O)-methyltransferase [Myxococcales bacterium]|nr:16S rRNA (cytidine(1402)-2'-O)-methyltransferase [Myxococcales bacterium]
MGEGTLYLVATPIGNLEDITLRALRVLREADRIYAEDTRRTRVLLERHSISARPRSLHAHNEARRTEELRAALADGEQIALVSDAGTPLLSDPGARAVAAAVADGHPVVPVPGPSAALSALTASGLGGGPFTFVGFLPRKVGERGRRLAELAPRAETLIFFESPRRLGETLVELADAFGSERRGCVARELTKLHEECVRGTLAELAARFAEPPKGELTIVVEGAADARISREAVAAGELDGRIRSALQGGRSPRAIAETLAAEGAPKRAVYSRALELRG